MAYVDPNQTTPAAAQPAAAQAGLSAPIASGGAGVGGASKATPSTPGVNVPAQPSAQLSAYLAANVPQSTAFASNVAGQVGNQINAAGSGIPGAVNTYTGNLYNVQSDPTVNKAVENSPSSLTPEQQATYEQEIGAAANTPNSSSTFETTAPYQGLVTGIQNAVQQANLWNSGNSVADLSTALQPYEGTNSTTGDTMLDSLLLSQTPSGYSQIQNAVAPAANLQSQLNAGATSADAALQGAIANDTQATADANTSAETFVNNLNAYLNNTLSTDQSAINAYNTQLNNFSDQEGNLMPDIENLQSDIAAYNNMVGTVINPGGGFGSPGLLSPFNISSTLPLAPVASNPTASQVGTAQNYADLASLENYLGNSQFTSLNPTITPETASQAGSYTAPTLPTPSSNYLNYLVDPVLNSVQSDITSIDPIVAANPNNPVLGGDLQEYVAPIQTDYAALVQALNTLNQQNQGPVTIDTPPPGKIGLT